MSKAHPTPSLTPLEQALKNQALMLEVELEADPRWRQLQILKKTLAELEGLRKTGPINGAAISTKVRRARTVPEGAQFALEDAGIPLSTAEIFERLIKYGKIPGGKKPTWNLSNMISSKDAFVSIDWKGMKRWWLAGKPVPKEG
jgi:hypothetical protein